MFTGIIEAQAKLQKMEGHQFTLTRPSLFTDVRLGSSIAVSGVCLSVTHLDEGTFSFDVVPETLKRSKLGSLKVGDSLNLERALSATGRFEGHIVQGHVEGLGRVEKVTKVESGAEITIRIPTELLSMIVSKGSITLDGVSLTVADIQNDLCTIALIPLTLEQTTLGNLHEGDTVNVETDILGKYVRNLHT